MKKMDISSINISESFANSHPREGKLAKCRNNWNQFHSQDRYIVVDFQNNLIDGYIQYLILKENGIDKAEVIISGKRRKFWHRKNMEPCVVPPYKNEETTYIYGMHYNKEKGEFSKEYVWRVPKSWSEAGWENGLLPGDDILANTKHGLKPVTITKIVRTDKCPVIFPVKRVAKKFTSQLPRT